MLNNIPLGISRMARNVIINHPNAWEANVYRKSVTRVAPEMGGTPTLGGLGVVDAEDEEQVTWDWIGNAYVVQADVFQPALLMDRQDANDGAVNEFRFLIEPEMQSGMPGHFDPRNRDVVLLVLSDDVRLAFEIVGSETPLNIPPFATRYVVNRRGDFDPD